VKRPLELAGIALLLAGLTIFVTWPQARQLAYGVDDFGDPLMNSWTLAWVAHTLPTHPTRLFDANIFYPEKRTLAYSETLVVPALLVAPLLWLGGGPILAHNLLLLAGYVASGLATYVLVLSLTKHRGAALVAAVVFALYPYRAEEYAKVQLQLIFWTPFALWAIHRLRADPGSRAGVLAGVFAALQMYSCVYYGIFAMVPLGIVAIATVATARADDRRQVLRALLVGIVVCGALCVPLAAAHYDASRIVGERSADDVRNWSARPADFLRANPDNKMYGDSRNPGKGELRMFPGWTAPALTLAAFVPPIAPLTESAVAYAAAGAISAELALGLNGIGFRTLFEVLPPFRALRVPARFVMLVGLSLSILAGFGVARLCRGRSRVVQAAIVAIAAAAVTAESNNHPLQLSELPRGIPQVYSWLANEPRTVICEYPVGNLQGRAGPQDATYMYYSTWHWQPMVNGYSGFAPPSYFELLDRLRSFPDDRSIAYLRERRVDLLLVHSAYYIKGNFSEDVNRLRRRADIDWVGEFPAPNGQVTDVFRIRASSAGG
jgi:hypothetical protein